MPRDCVLWTVSCDSSLDWLSFIMINSNNRRIAALSSFLSLELGWKGGSPLDYICKDRHENLATINFSDDTESACLHIVTTANCCTFISRAQLGLYLERIPLENDKKAVKVLRLCQQYDMSEQGSHFFFKVSPTFISMSTWQYIVIWAHLLWYGLLLLSLLSFIPVHPPLGPVWPTVWSSNPCFFRVVSCWKVPFVYQWKINTFHLTGFSFHNFLYRKYPSAFNNNNLPKIFKTEI